MGLFPNYQIKPVYVSFVWLVDRIGGIITSPWRILRKPLNKKAIKKILVIRLDNLGDLLVSTPFLRSLRTGFPDVDIDVLIKPVTRPILEENPDIDGIIEFDAPWLHRSGALRMGKSLASLVNDPLIDRLRHENYDLVIELHTDPRNILLSWMIRGRRRIGHDVRGLGFLLTDVVPFRNDLHIIDRTLLFSRYLGCPNKGRGLTLRICADWKKEASSFVKKHHLKEFVCINPGTGRENKYWLDGRWAQVADALVEKGVSVVFTGSKEDLGHVQKIRASMKQAQRTVIAAGSVSLGGTCALIATARLFLSPDTGPMHIARAVGTPTIGLFGPIDPTQWGYHDAMSTSLSGFGACRCKNLPDCVLSSTDRYLCMRKISVEEVLGAVDRLWDAKKLSASTTKRSSATRRTRSSLSRP